MNSCNFVGNLGKDWETSNSNDGKPIAKNSMAVKKYNNEVIWINIIAFGKIAETLSQHTVKGSGLAIKSEIDVNIHEGKYYASFIINGFTFIGQKPSTQQQGFANQDQDQQQNQNQGYQGYQNS